MSQSQPASYNTTATTKSERKQSLVNKCLNERRRRDQENQYFEELAEIISASITDMSNSFSVRPEKCAILQETVKQIKQIKQGSTSGDTAVQQSHVSSSKPAVLADDILGPLLLEALDGFLFVVNSQGKVEFVSDNVTQFLKYSQDEVIGKSVYNIIHVGDHAQFSNTLLPMSVSSGINWPSDNLGGKGKFFNCRLLIKPPGNDDDIEAKQTCIPQYETMQISTILHPSDSLNDNCDNSEANSSLVCIARRLPLAEKTNTMLGVEQFTTKQDLNGKIIGCDVSGIVPGRFSCPDFVGLKITEFCHINDQQQLTKHLQETVENGSNTSAVYRFKLQENKFVFVQTKSKLFQNAISGSGEFIMSTHSIVRECNSDDVKGSASTSLKRAIIGPSIQQQTQQTKMQASLSALNPSLANMAAGIGLGENFVNDNFFAQTGNWDTNQMLDSMMSSNSNVNNNNNNNNNNYSFQSTNVSNTSTSFVNSRNTQLKQSQVQQQLQRSMSTRELGSKVPNMLPGSLPKRPTLSQFAQRSSSLDLGQAQAQGHLQSQLQNQGAKSPGVAASPGSRNGTFQLPGQRGMMGYNRRSPAASPVSHVQGNYMPFPRTPSPMLSPSPGMNQSNWPGHQPMISQHSPGLHGHQGGYDNQPISSPSAVTGKGLLQKLSGGLDLFSGEKNISRPGRLCQLLTQNSPPSSTHEPGTPKSVRSRHNSRQGLMEMSPADSIQSPQPGPGQSPPEKPQSTSNDDGDHVVHTESKDRNKLLKSLLSQDDEEEEVAANTTATGPPKIEQSAEAQAVQPKETMSALEMEKNEAEAKKPPNLLLKQLLSSDDERLLKGAVKDSNADKRPGWNRLILRSLDENGQCRSVPAESTSADLDLARQRHQSGPQEPQSTTTHPLPIPQLSSPLTSPTTSGFLPLQVSSSNIGSISGSSISVSIGGSSIGGNSISASIGGSSISASIGGNSISGEIPIPKSMFSSGTNMITSVNVSNSLSSSALPNVSSSVDPMGKEINRNSEITTSVNNKKIDKLLTMLWEGENKGQTMRMRIETLKRKADLMEPSDLEPAINNAAASGSSQAMTIASKLSKENALLTQLLSKKANNEIVVNTLNTIQPSGVPQSRFTSELASKILKVNPTGNSTASSATGSDSNSNKRPRTENVLTSASQLERALSQKSDMPTNSVLETVLAMGQNSNSNSGISSIGNDTNQSISASQFKEQYAELQQMLSQTAGDNNNTQSTVAMEVDLADNGDPLLAQILQQATELQQDISAAASSNQISLNPLPLESGNSSAQQTSLNPNNINFNNSGNSRSNQNGTPPVDIIQQLEQVLSDPNLTLDLEGLLGGSGGPTDLNDQLAIDAIQEQLMREMPGQVSEISTSSVQTPPQQASLQQQNFVQSMSDSSHPTSSQMIRGDPQVLVNQLPRMQMVRGQYQQVPLRPGYSGPGRPPGVPQPHQGYGQSPPGQSYPGQGPRLPHPQGSLASALQSPTQPQRPPMFSNASPNSTAMQVRLSLLQQQKQKQLRERDKQRLQQTQDRQKLLLQQQQQRQQQQQQQQYNQQFSPAGQRFPPHDNMGMGNSGVLPAFPENLAELMNSGTAPNVTLQRNQIPGPMSPRFAQGLPQPQQSPTGAPGQMMPPNPQLSPNFSQQQQQQWSMRQGQGNMNISPQGSTQYSRHRSLSGGTMQAASPQRFPFSSSEAQFSGNQGMGALYSQQQQQQQQQMFQQHRNGQLQRQLSMPGRGSPRTSQGQFAPGQDPLLMSPHNISPNSVRGAGIPQQPSPSYNQSPSVMKPPYVQSSLTPPTSTMTSPQYSQNQALLGMGSQSVDLDMNLFDNSKKPLDVPLSVSTPGATQYIKQELRNICNARSKPQQMQQQQAVQMLQRQQSPQYNNFPQNPVAAPPQMLDQEPMSELPLDILEQINEMSAEHRPQGNFKEDIVLPKKREEAKKRYEKFCNLASSEDPEEKATNLFRKQLQSREINSQGKKQVPDGHGGFKDAPQVNVVQNQPRTPIEEIKPANQKDSLLQQLLSD